MDFKFVQVGTEDCPVRNFHKIMIKADDYHKLHENWPSLATELEVNLADIKQLKQDQLLNKMQLSEVVRQVLEIWVGKDGSEATLDKLLLALKSIGLTLTADLIQKEYQIQNSIITELTYYVNRTLITRSNLNKERLIKELANSDDIFIFSGISLPALNNIFENETPAHSTKLIGDKMIQKCIVLDHRSHFDKICKLTNCPVHLIHCEEDKWTHLKSNDNFSAIQALTDKDQMRSTEEEFIAQRQLGNHPICIADSPGMGKTTLLHSFCQKLRHEFSDRVVWLVGMNQFVNIFKANGGKSGIQDMRQIDAIVEATCFALFCAKPSQKSLISSKLQSNDLEIELMLDGLDEVVASNTGLAFEILEHLQKYSSIRLWVSTRPHLLQELESSLNVFGYNLQPFNEKDQIDFLKRFWSSESDCLDFSRLETFADNCLSELKLKLSKKDEDIAGIPLQCLLIGEVYKDQALEHSALNDPNDSGIIHVGSLIELYNGLVKKQTQKYMKTYGENRLTETEIHLQHVELSLKFIFPDLMYSLQEKYKTNLRLEELLKVGLLQKSSTISEPKFIHRTIGEYFIAYLILQFLESKADNSFQLLQTKLLKKVFECKEMELEFCSSFKTYKTKSYCFLNNEICYFINILIGNKTLQYDFEASKEYMNEMVPACVYGDYFGIFTALNNLNLHEILDNSIFSDGFLYLAIWYSSAKFVEFLFENVLNKLTKETDIHLMFFAVKSGNISTCQYLINKQNFRKMLKPPYCEPANLVLHECVENTLLDTKSQVQQKIEILRLLSGINNDLLEEQDSYFRTPILCKSIHPLLLNELIISKKVNIFARDAHLNTVFHIHYSKCDVLFEYIESHSIKNLLQLRNLDKNTPLLTLIQHHQPKQETLDKFKEHDADFNCKDKKGRSVLAVCIKKGRSSETVQKVIKCGGNFKCKKGFKRKSLVHYAGQYGNVSAMLCLAEVFKMSLRSKDWSFMSAIDYLMKSVKKQGHTINYNDFDRLIKLAPKAKLHFDNKTKEIVFIKSMESMNDSAIEYLIKDGTDFLENIKETETQVEVMKKWANNFQENPGCKILKHLITVKFVEADSPNSTTSLFYIAVEFGNVESVNFLIDYRLNLHKQQGSNGPPSELFGWLEYIKIVHF